MDGAFFDAFNSVLPDMEAQFTETWILNGVEWPAIFIDTLDEDHHLIKGGALVSAHVKVQIREDIFEQSGVLLGETITVRGIDLMVNQFESDGDASRALLCSPKGTDVWK
jgi:hypothetical protein